MWSCGSWRGPGGLDLLLAAEQVTGDKARIAVKTAAKYVSCLQKVAKEGVEKYSLSAGKAAHSVPCRPIFLSQAPASALQQMARVTSDGGSLAVER